MSLQEMYQEVLLAHNENPNNFRAIENASCSAQGNNPLCGDEITVYLQFQDGKISDISFLGQGCAICKASASLMTSRLLGLNKAEAEKVAQDIIQLINDDTQPIPEDLGELEAILGVRKFPARIKCATLAWHTFLKALQGKGSCNCKSSQACPQCSGHCC